MREKKEYYISEVTERKILEKIAHWETLQLFRDPDYNISAFSEDIGYNRKYLSHLVNREFNMRFSTYINLLRWRFMLSVLEEIPDKQVANLTSLAKEAGFSRYLKFAHFIRQHFGKNPTEHIRSILGGRD